MTYFSLLRIGGESVDAERGPLRADAGGCVFPLAMQADGRLIAEAWKPFRAGPPAASVW
jgi:hypothetical protein